MQLQENISLKQFNTFGISVKARWFGAFDSLEQFSELIIHASRLTSHALRQAQDAKNSTLILGGGSNILFTKDFDGLVLKNEVKGIEKLKEDNDFVYIKVGAGENWHQFVQHCIENDWAGLENLSLIPGCVGASPMQNIGAYGVEISSAFYELNAFHLDEKTNYTFKAKDCEFGYRDSVFKRKYKDQFVITHVSFVLRKVPVFNTSYGAINQELERIGVRELSIKAISDAVIRIRRSKLPDPAIVGNAGSFFKNPSVTKEKFISLQTEFPNIVGYENADGSVKLAAGWLIEHSGPAEDISWKGFRMGDAGCHSQQALVLVNDGKASGSEINELAGMITGSIKTKYGVELEKEVNII